MEHLSVKRLLLNRSVFTLIKIYWNVHFDNFCKKIAAIVFGVQKRARAFVPSDTLQNMYNINFLGHSTVIFRRGEDTSETQNRSSVNY